MRSDKRGYRFAGAQRLLAGLGLAASLAVPHVILGQTRVGSEFQVNTYTTESQREPSVAFTGLGDFVVVWNSHFQDGQESGIFGQRFSSTGAALGGEFQVNEFTLNDQSRPSVASSASGDFVVVWQSAGQDSDDLGIVARRFSSAGAPVATEFQVTTYTTTNRDYPSLAVAPDGDFVVVWQSYVLGDTDTRAIVGRRFSSAGDPLGSELQINTLTGNNPRVPSVAMAADGRFVVAWETYPDDFSEYGAVAQRFSSEGAPLGGEMQVGTFTAFVDYVTVAVHGDGGFVVVWESYGEDGYGGGIFARRFSSSGDALADELQINTYTDGGEFAPALAVTPDGGFIVVWGAYLDAGGDGTFARRYTSAGTPLADAFQVSSFTSIIVGYPAIAIDAAGDFVVAWGSYGQDDELADEGGVFAQRFTLDTPGGVELDIDGDGETDALTDGLLVLRRLFGFTGTTLISGAVDTANCSRCAAEDIASYIDGLGLALDIDGDTDLESLTDGLLVLRYLFGFTGTTLTSGVVDTGGCTRCDAAAIEPYLSGLDG